MEASPPPQLAQCNWKHGSFLAPEHPCRSCSSTYHQHFIVAASTTPPSQSLSATHDGAASYRSANPAGHRHASTPKF
eukprot:157150-Rhodomonas_salina.1